MCARVSLPRPSPPPSADPLDAFLLVVDLLFLLAHLFHLGVVRLPGRRRLPERRRQQLLRVVDVVWVEVRLRRQLVQGLRQALLRPRQALLLVLRVSCTDGGGALGALGNALRKVCLPAPRRHFCRRGLGLPCYCSLLLLCLRMPFPVAGCCGQFPASYSLLPCLLLSGPVRLRCLVDLGDPTTPRRLYLDCNGQRVRLQRSLARSSLLYANRTNGHA